MQAAESDDSEEEQRFFVEQILDFSNEFGDRYYVKWWNYSNEHNTWEPPECLDDPPESYTLARGVRQKMRAGSRGKPVRARPEFWQGPE